MGAGASCGPDLNRDKGRDEIILMVSRQLFWGRVSCQEHTYTSLSITPADEGMDTRVILSKAVGVFGLVLVSCHGKLRSWKKGSLTSWFPFHSRMLDFSLGTRPPCFPSTHGLILGRR